MCDVCMQCVYTMYVCNAHMQCVYAMWCVYAMRCVYAMHVYNAYIKSWNWKGKHTIIDNIVFSKNSVYMNIYEYYTFYVNKKSDFQKYQK